MDQQDAGMLIATVVATHSRSLELGPNVSYLDYEEERR
jgi:hypothetical protein